MVRYVCEEYSFFYAGLNATLRIWVTVVRDISIMSGGAGCCPECSLIFHKN